MQASALPTTLTALLVEEARAGPMTSPQAEVALMHFIRIYPAAISTTCPSASTCIVALTRRYSLASERIAVAIVLTKVHILLCRRTRRTSTNGTLLGHGRDVWGS